FDVLVAAHAAGPQARRAALAQAELLPGLRARRHLEQRLAVHGRHFDLRAERRFRHGNRHHTVDVVAAPLEVWVVADVRRDEEVAGRAAVLTGVAAACDAHARAGFDARGDARRHGLAPRGDARAVTLRTRAR